MRFWPPIAASTPVRSRIISPVLWWALLLGILVHLAGFFIFHVATKPMPSAGNEVPFVRFLPDRIMRDGAILQERASLFDSAPLFIPTRWSSTAQGTPLFNGERLPVFGDYLPDFSLVDELRPGRSFGLEEHSVRRLEDLLALRFLDPLASVGQQASELVSLEPWVATMEVRQLQPIAGMPGAESRLLPLGSFEGFSGQAQPLRIYLRIGPSGRLLSRPVLVESSGREAIDSRVLEMLIAPSMLARLPSGYLEISVFL